MAGKKLSNKELALIVDNFAVKFKSLENWVQDLTSKLESKDKKYEILKTKLTNLTQKLQEVMEKTKSKDQNLVCDKCGYACMRKSEMKQHRMDRHQKVSPEKKCNICKKTCAKNCDLERHIRSSHESDTYE